MTTKAVLSTKATPKNGTMKRRRRLLKTRELEVDPGAGGGAFERPSG